jgi:adenylate cyclase
MSQALRASNSRGPQLQIADVWHGLVGGSHERVSKEFDHLLMREVMRSELMRVRALIVVTVALAVIVTLVHIFWPEVVQRIWRGGVSPNSLYPVLIGFILLELWIYRAISHHLKIDRDIPVYRRYLGAFIETSLPTFVLALQIESMGPVRALGFVMPLVYFIFVVLSTLRLDFWLSTFTGFVAATELFYMALHYHPEINPDLEPEIYYHVARSLVIFLCGVLAGAVGVQLRRGFAASIMAATARDRVTSLFGQHVSPQVVERLLLERTSTESDIRQVAVMFVDFRSFTAGARSRSPQHVVERLDGAFAVLVEILDRHGGIVNKFLGDGFLALFGAPFEAEDPAPRAVAAAREMLAAMERINKDTSWPLRIGIGFISAR